MHDGEQRHDSSCHDIGFHFTDLVPCANDIHWEKVFSSPLILVAKVHFVALILASKCCSSPLIIALLLSYLRFVSLYCFILLILTLLVPDVSLLAVAC